MKNAYDTLSDPIARMEYDDTLPFEDPEGKDEEEEDNTDEDEEFEQACESVQRQNRHSLWQRPEPT